MQRGRFRMLRSAMAGVEAVEAETSHTFARHTHEQFGIGVIHRGAQKSASGRGMVEAGAGDVITVNPGEVHDGAPIGDGGRAWRILYFDPAVIAAAAGDISEGGIATCELPQPVMRNAGAARRLEKLFAVITAGKDGTATLQDELLLLLLAEILQERAGRDDSRSSVPRGVFAALSRIDDDPAAPVSLSDLALESGLSRFQVLRGFARATGLTPHAYLVQRRIDLSRRLIAGGAPLAEAAFAGGFADQSHMTRVFIAKYGLTPRAYARAMN